MPGPELVFYQHRQADLAERQHLPPSWAQKLWVCKTQGAASLTSKAFLLVEESLTSPTAPSLRMGLVAWAIPACRPPTRRELQQQ